MKRATVVLISVMVFSLAFGADLKIANVSAPAINCKFDTDCKITVQDFSDAPAIPGTTGTWFLQSRRWPVGEPGTAGAGLYPYLYRIHLSGLVSSPKKCVSELTLDFGPVQKLDYNGDGVLDHVFVITSGGIGTAAPVTVTQTGTKITFKFPNHPCSGITPNTGESSFFIGLASKQAATNVTAQITGLTAATPVSVQAKAPLPTPPPQPSMKR